MPQKFATKQSKCYCNSVGSTCCNGCIVNCLKGRFTGTESILSAASKNNKQKQNFTIKNTTQTRAPKTDFVKLNRKATSATAANRRGRGHSNATQNHTYSRRNSATTSVTFSSAPPPSVSTVDDTRSSKVTTPSSIKTPSPTPPRINKLKSTPVTMATLSGNFRTLSVAAKGDTFGGGKLQHEYTEQRSNYESIKQLMKLVNSQGDTFSSLNIPSSCKAFRGSIASDGSDIYNNDLAVDEQRLRALQEFRLKNTDDCFSVHRQLDMRLPMQQKGEDEHQLVDKQQQIRKLLSTLLGQDELAKHESGKQQLKLSRNTTESNVKLTKKEKPNPTLTPYAVRQKLLQIRMEADEIGRMKPGRKLYGEMGNSFSLRYQET